MGIVKSAWGAALIVPTSASIVLFALCSLLMLGPRKASILFRRLLK